MATINCPSCGKPNPDTVEICQYCGTVLKRASTVPLPPLHPGDMPTKKKTSDLESTLPGWLRDIRQGSGSESSSPEEKPAETPRPVQPAAPQPPKPVSPKPREAASPLDFLAGLSQANEDEEETPDWLKSIQSGMPAAPVQPTKAPEPPAEEPADWLSGLQSQTQPEESPAPSEPDWGFGNQPATFNFDESTDQAAPISGDTPDWLNALKAQTDESTQPGAFESPVQPAEWQAPDTGTPDWLSALSDSSIGTTSVQPASAEQPLPPSASDETPDWLSALSDSGIGTTAVQPEPSKPQPAPADEMPDWMASMAAAETGAPFAEQPSTQADDTADWLASLGENTAAPAEQTPAPSALNSETPDWLSGLAESSAAPTQQPSAPSAQDDTPDWLASLGGSDAVVSEPFSAPSAPADTDTPDWLSSLGGETGAAQHPTPSTPVPQPSVPSAQDDTPDWLASLGGSDAVVSEPFSASSAPADTGTPDWLSSLGGETGAAQPPAPSTPVQQPSAPSAQDDTPDWLASLGGETGAAQPAAPSTPAQQPDEMSDWLSSLGSGPLSQTEPAPAEPSATASDADLLPWLSGLNEAQPPAERFAPEQPASTAAQPVDSDLPPWMADLQGTPAAGTPAPADVPDWMTSLSAEPPQTPPADLPGAVPSTDSELPSWLADAMGEKPADKLGSTGKPFNTGALKELGPLDETPDWMATIGQPSSAPVELPEEKPLQEPEIPAKPAQIPASSEAPTLPPGSGEEQNMDAIFSMDMPDWLSGFTPTEAETTEAKSVEQQPVDENLSPAELPSWVQAMRPVEDVMGGKINQAEDEDAPVESQGPLAGLRSVLPGLPTAPSVHKPKAYSIKLQVGESQQAQAALLEQILNSESKPQAVAKRSDAVIILPLRWVIAAILLITILLGALLPDITGGSIFPAPDQSQSSEHEHIGAFREIIDELPDSANVLIVADYQPGFAGEMEPVAEPALDQLMAKNTRLAFISTSPVGSYMAERLVQKFSKKYPYEIGTQYVNLGYLPGGAGGIQVFSELPLTTVGRDWFQGNLWEKDALKAVTKFSNFAAVIVMTDNPDTGRLWIEQAEPSLRPKPMLMVTSAQAEPMLRPYVASGQIKGMVSGLEDGVLYESLLNSAGQARSYWEPFGIAILAAELLIIVGGVWGLISGSRARRANKTDQDEA